MRRGEEWRDKDWVREKKDEGKTDRLTDRQKSHPQVGGAGRALCVRGAHLPGHGVQGTKCDSRWFSTQKPQGHMDPGPRTWGAQGRKGYSFKPHPEQAGVVKKQAVLASSGARGVRYTAVAPSNSQ